MELAVRRPRCPVIPLKSPLQPPSAEHDWALFLDVDGTLLEIADTPGGIEVRSDTVPLLERLRELLGGAVALVSGRSLECIDRMLAPLQLPAAGLHGVERRLADGTVLRGAASRDGLNGARRTLDELGESCPGSIVEDKGGAIAVHYRLAPECEDEVKRVVYGLAAELGGQFRVQEGKMVVELKPASAGKDTAVAAFLREPPFLSRRPVFVGDDLTDEDGFAEVNRRGGVSIRVGELNSSEARYCLRSVGEVHRWLAEVVQRLEA